MTTTTTQFRVPDMHCEGCTERVTNVLERLDGVRSAEVSLADKTAMVEIEDGSVNFDALKAAVEKAGYTVES
jgi:copper chaperone CopZ